MKAIKQGRYNYQIYTLACKFALKKAFIYKEKEIVNN